MTTRINLLSRWPGTFRAASWTQSWLHLSPDAKRGIVDVIVTRHAPDDWGDVWYLDVGIRDQAGVLNEIAACLTSTGLTVDQVQNSTDGHYLAARFTLTARGYRSPRGHGHLDRVAGVGSLMDTDRFVQVKFMERLKFMDGKPVLSITPNATLAQLRHAHADREHLVEASQHLTTCRGTFAIPKRVKAYADHWIASYHGVTRPVLRTPIIARCDDPSGDFVKFVLGYAETGVAGYRSRTPIPGSVSDLTDRLCRNGYDIIASSLEARNGSSSGELMVVDLLVDQKPTSPAALHDRLEAVVRGQVDSEDAA